MAKVIVTKAMIVLVGVIVGVILCHTNPEPMACLSKLLGLLQNTPL
jgi:hypothetical protein